MHYTHATIAFENSEDQNKYVVAFRATAAVHVMSIQASSDHSGTQYEDVQDSISVDSAPL
jgi:hypothetical protein